MGLDRKRIVGPEKTSLPLAAAADEKVEFKVEKRVKREQEHRPLFVGLQLVSGSFIELGNKVKMTGKVFQKQHQNTSLFVDFKFAPFAQKSRRGYAKVGFSSIQSGY